MTEALMIIGFLLAAYAIIGNDSIQTLGTFLYSNSHRPWWILWVYSSVIMVAVVIYGWANYNGDPSYNRLNKVYSKSVSLDAAQEALQTAQLAMAAEPEQQRVLAELEAVDAALVETKRIFVEMPMDLDAAKGELVAVLEPLRAELLREDVPNPQKVAVAKVVEEVDAVMARMELRRDVSQFIDWTYLLPPLALLLLTRYGFPVSTSFLVLITFQPAVMGSMLTKSLMGYLVAFLSAVFLYTLVMRWMERRWKDEGEGQIKPIWVVFQWCSTAFLWSMWLVQDMANIFVYLPRFMEVNWLIFAVVWMVVVQGIIYYTHGGKIQKVVTSKTNTHDIRSATIVDLLYGVVLFIFKVQSNVPMSTTWVFLGLLAGRELAFALTSAGQIKVKHAVKLARKDIVKAGFGLGVSVALAILINRL